MLFLVATLFLISKFVFISFWYIRNYSSRMSIHFQYASVGFNLARLLILANHSANSIVYIIFFKSFRETLFLLLCCNRKNKQGNREQTSMTDVSQGVSTGTCVDGQWLNISCSVSLLFFLLFVSCPGNLKHCKVTKLSFLTGKGNDQQNQVNIKWRQLCQNGKRTNRSYWLSFLFSPHFSLSGFSKNFSLHHK